MHTSSQPSSDLPDHKMDLSLSEHAEVEVSDYLSSSDDDNGDEENEEHSRRREALDGLEAIALSFTRQLADGMHALLSGEKKPKVTIQLKKRGRDVGQSAIKRVSFPGRWHGAGARPIAQLLVIIDALHEAILEDLPVTKRDIYYRNTELFQNQTTVDRFIDDLAATLDVSRVDLNVRASGKGLFCGSSIVIHLKRGGSIHGSDSSGALIPDSGDIAHFEIVGDVKWVLIVEKEAVFQTLCGLSFAAGTHDLGPGIILTGKGYPDVATRQLLATLSDNLPENVVFGGLVDADPYGLDILSVYVRGSAALAHETGLIAPRVRWIGLSLHDLEEFGIDRAAVIQLTANDEKKARSMLARTDCDLPKGCRAELEHMVATNAKAEIEILCDAQRMKNVHPMIRYLVHKISKMTGV